MEDKYKEDDYVYVKNGLRSGIRDDGLYVVMPMTQIGNKRMQIEQVLRGADRYRLRGVNYYFASDMLYQKSLLPTVNNLLKTPLPKL